LFSLPVWRNLTISEYVGVGSDDLGAARDSHQAYVVYFSIVYVPIQVFFPAIIIINVLNYYDSLRVQLVKAVEAGFINAPNVGFITFVDGPANLAEHADYDWGSAVIDALENWKPIEWEGYGLDWTKKKDGSLSSPLNAV
jgi:hypothetical protein